MDKLLSELQHLLVDTLDLADINPNDINPDDALFGSGLNLDSIDALELAVTISKRYGVSLKADDEQTSQAFQSLRALAQHIQGVQANPLA